MARYFFILVLISFAACVPLVIAARCPSYAEVANMSNLAVAQFDISKFPGMWYEIYSHNLPGLTSGCHCTRYNVSMEKGGWRTDFACKKGDPQSSPTMLHSDNRFAVDPKYPGMLTESWKLPVGRTPTTAYWVLDVGVDAEGGYERALVYSCTSELIAKQEWIYLFSRTPTLLKANVADWKSYMTNKGIDISDVTAVPQDSSCWSETSVLV